MTVQITEGTQAELPLVRPLWLGMAAHHRSMLAGRVAFLDENESWRRRQAKYTRWFAEPGAFVLLARLPDRAPRGAAEDRPVGYLFGRVVPDGDSSTADFAPSVGAVESLSVAAEARGTGVGSALLAAGRDAFVQRGCVFWSIGVVHNNTRAAALYERTGFQPWEQHLIAPLTDDRPTGDASQ